MNELIEYANSIMAFLNDEGATLNVESQLALGELLQNVLQTIETQGQAQQQPPPQAPTNGPEPHADAQLLWILAGQQEQAFISYLRTYPTAATQQLLNNPQELSRVIDHLSRTMPQGQQPVVDGIQHSDLNSSNVWGTAYDPKSGKMKVRFQGGAEYEYDGIPANIYRAFTSGNANARTKGRNQYGEWWPNKNPSLGAALNQYIKAGNFPYRRLN